MSAWRVPVYVIAVAIGEHPDELSAIEHLHHVELLIGFGQRFPVHRTVALSHCLNGIFEFVCLVFIYEITVGCPLPIDAQHLLHITVFYTNQLLLFPWRVVYHPTCENLVGRIARPRRAARQFGDKICCHGVERTDAVVVNHVDGAYPVGNVLVYHLQAVVGTEG